jgi:hypothetical protein
VTPQLRQLIDGAGGQAAFGRTVWGGDAISEHKGKVAKWYYGRSGISTTEARSIAERFAVTTDWLFGIPNASKYRDQQRGDATLAADLASHLAREVAGELVVPIGDVVVDGSSALEGLVRSVAAQCRADRDRVGKAWPLARETAHVENAILSLAARAHADGSAVVSNAPGASDQDYEFISRAARTTVERLERFRASADAAAWTGPARIVGDSLGTMLRGQGGRADLSEDERRLRNFARPERSPKVELRRKRAYNTIVARPDAEADGGD